MQNIVPSMATIHTCPHQSGAWFEIALGRQVRDVENVAASLMASTPLACRGQNQPIKPIMPSDGAT